MNKKPTKVGYYTVIKRIGHGAFAKVDLAVHELLDTKVAIKIISRKKATFQKNFNKFLDEIEIYRELNHRNVVKLFEVLKSEHSLYLVMEYAPKGDLYSILNAKTKFNEPEARHYFRQMISALIYCHAKGYAHRDLKLENIFLDDLNDIKIGDFGLAGKLRPGTLMATSCGSLRYAAPEILKGKLYSGELADVWSCGVILFTFLSGYHPFEDDVYVTLLQKIKRNNYTVPLDISGESVDLIKKILQADCNRRITMSEILCHPWVTYTSFPKYIDQKFSQIQNKSTRVVKVPIEVELIAELAKKKWDFVGFGLGVNGGGGLDPSGKPKSPSLSDLTVSVTANEDSSFVVGYNLCRFEKAKIARIEAKEHTLTPKKHHFRLGFIKDLFDDPVRAERFHRTFRAYTIDLLNDYDRRPWRVGLNFYSNLKRVIRTFVRAATAESVKVEVLSGLEFRFRCHPLDASRCKTDELFVMQVFQNSSDEYVLDFVNENMSNLRFILLCFKLFKRMKV
jgi:5'-AMP-activated protein kinase catalytic alpha subunit